MEINWPWKGSSGWNDAPCDRSDRGRFVCKKSERGETRKVRKPLVANRRVF